VTLAAVLFIQHCPLIYYAYAGFPVFFWQQVLANRETLKQGMKVLMQSKDKKMSPFTIASQGILYIGILESLVWILDTS
jgi:phosphatidylinositol glycan class N